MKIIVNNASHLCKCYRCKSELEVSPSDIKSHSSMEQVISLINESEKDWKLITRYYFVCPCCEAKNYVDLKTFYTFEPSVD